MASAHHFVTTLLRRVRALIDFFCAEEQKVSIAVSSVVFSISLFSIVLSFIF